MSDEQPEVPAAGVPLAPSLTARVGFELEIGGVKVQPFLPKGTILVEGNGWNLETDKLPNKRIADLEFVTSPMSELAPIERAMDEMIDVVAAIRSRALGSASGLVGLADLDRGSTTWRVRDEVRSHWLHVRNIHFTTRLQSTYGIGLAQFAHAMDRFLPLRSAKAIHEATHKVEAFHQERTGLPFSPGVRGFIHLVNYYMRCVQRVSNREATVHIFFRVYMRSDFCAVVDKLLDDADRQVVESLFETPPGRDVPPFMEVLGLEAGKLLFRQPYCNQNYEREAGPTIESWLGSILHGRGEGAFKKDLMSPPPGYRLHVDDPDANYGGGAMGVDEANELALFEIRHAPHRQDAPLNLQIKRCAVREFMHAQQFNPSLRGDASAFAAIVAAFDLLRMYDAVYYAFHKLKTAIDVLAAHPVEEHRSRVFDVALPRLRACRQALNDHIAVRQNCVTTVDAPLPALDAWVAMLDGTEGAALPTMCPAVRQMLAEFEGALWDAQNMNFSSTSRL